jgi:hypothetical protein
MTLDFTVPGEVKISMIPYVKEIVQLFFEYNNFQSTAATPAAEHLFKVNDKTSPLTEQQTTLLPNVYFWQNKPGLILLMLWHFLQPASSHPIKTTGRNLPA